jgi:hypothetical protein
MKKLLLSGITAAALMAAGTAQASDLSINGETGLARTPLAMSLAPMQFAIAADYVASDNFQAPVRAEIGLPLGFEVGGAYYYIDSNFDITNWGLNAKWVLPKFVEGLGLAVGGNYQALSVENIDMDAYRVYGVASYTANMGEGMALIPSFGVAYIAMTDDSDVNAFRFFGSLILKAGRFAVGGEYTSTDEDFDGPDADGDFWVGGRFYLNPMVTLQAGYLNNANYTEDFNGDPTDGVFHIGAQFAFSSGK